MNKRLLIMACASVLAIGGALTFGFVAHNAATNLVGVKAETKEFTFNESVAQAQFSSESTVVNKSVVTGVSSNLETEVSLTASSAEHVKSFGDNGYFVRNGSTVTDPVFLMEIGVNNITGVTVTYGLNHTSSTVANEVQCSIRVFEKGERVDETGTSVATVNSDLVLNWTKEVGDEFTGDSIKVRVAAVGGSVFWGEPLYIKSIHLTWAC